MDDLETRVAMLTKPIIGLENRTPLEVFDMMCDRIQRAVRQWDQEQGSELVEAAYREGWQLCT